MSKYRQLKQSKNGSDFELIFVSADKNPDAMIKHMQQKRMPWPALKFIETNSAAGVRKMTGTGIPSLVLVTDDGRYINSSYKKKGKGQYQGLAPVLATLDKLMNTGGGAANVEKATQDAVDDATSKAAQIFDVSTTRMTVAIVLASLTFLILFFKR